MPLQATSGAASYDAFGGGVPVVPAYIEDVFSTYLYTSTGGDITITNGIDLSTKGGLVWIKSRSNAFSHYLTDTVRGAGRVLYSNLVNGQSGPGGGGASSFSTTGYVDGNQNANGVTQVSWTFREQPKFFDVVTISYTGSAITVNHALGSVPGCIIIKLTTGTDNWYVYHRSNTGVDSTGALNTTLGFQSPNGYSNFASSINSTSFTFDAGFTSGTYVAYLFAHDAGGFGLTGTDNVISCGSFTTDGSGNATVSLGYEPQWLMTKSSSAVGDWFLVDNMRGFTVAGQDDAILKPNLSNAETASGKYGITSTGFTMVGGGASATHIYIAIRRGPMKVPTTGTTVFSPNVPTAFTQFTTGFPVDLGMWNYRTGYAENTVVNDRLRGVSTLNVSAFPNNLVTATTAAEAASQGTQNWNNTGLYAGTSGAVFYSFGRAPSFFDEVCYTGTGSARTVSHNLAAVPELMIVKRRDTAALWVVYSSATGNTNYLSLNGSSGSSSDSGTFWNSTTPTSSVFSVNTGSQVNGSSATFVAYLFATCAGVSKVGSYTGTGTTKQIDCGFTAGARFVLIKKTSGTGSWYVWDSARGIVSGNDPYLLLNSTAAEVTNTDYIDTYSAGFEISSTAPSEINENGGSFIFLAIS
jgi:hypothetical protein